MDMHISGSGKIPAGEYESISISGSGRLYGLVRCTSLGISGSAHGESVACSGNIRISGSGHFDRDVQANCLTVSGSANVGGDIIAAQEVRLAGGVQCSGSIKTGTLNAAGGLSVGSDMEAETAHVHGAVSCQGLLNAETVEIEMEGQSKIGSIGGSKILIYPKNSNPKKQRLSLFAKLSGKHREARVEQSIEGDEIALINVICPRVSGRIVAVGEGCEIELLQYSEKYEIHEKAKVGKIEKI